MISTASTARITVKAPWLADVILSKTEANADYGTDQKWFYAVLDADALPIETMTGYQRTKAEAIKAARQDMRNASVAESAAAQRARR